MESLTDELERRAEEWMARVAERGGMLTAVETGWVEGLLAEQAAGIQNDIEAGRRVVVGVNDFTDGNEDDLDDVFRVTPDAEDRQLERLAAVRAARDESACTAALASLRKAAAGTENLMPHIVECVRRRASEGEIISAMNSVWGEYRPTALF